eukprot:jgi/Tetstr1/445366/TSEL_033164.t1
MCSGGPLARTSCVPGLRKWPGHMAHWPPDGADQVWPPGSMGAHGAVAARWRQPAACPACESNRGTTCNGGPMVPTNSVPGLRKQWGRKVQRRPVRGDPLRARAVEATKGYMVQRRPDDAVDQIRAWGVE